ncbi:SLBB domain-containing protein [Ferruginibacter lapsinanis]|uniref:polysaccharide biosynthesis/export family protein n=1 Tax=Ferruginibacter lapsinanis TaxID=563172 RepID=UPI001E60F709|nr:SLBB domain-containing protein [Ferruginibacter lapsinanis]UEG50267.1 SLBB domain-containing protein [Ferruginibacter lapsinanis]
MSFNLKLLVNMRVKLLLVILMGSSLSAFCQPPVTTPVQEEVKGILTEPSLQAPQKNLKEIFGDNNKSIIAGEDKNKQTTTPVVIRDTLIEDNVKSNSYKSDDTYGTNIFKNAAMMNIAELSTPPLDYPIGVGDHIIVALWGGGEYQEDYVVAKDGSIFPASLGKITVQGLTFESARSLIYSRFKSVVPATTNVQITLGQPRTINVNVGGEVNNPGPVTVSAFSNAFNVIGLAGGVTQYGNLREIQVKRNGKVIETLDVYKYLTSGDIGGRIYLQNNDFVLVRFVDKKVLATGQFKRPMYYQLKKDEGIKALISFAGGFTPDAYSSDVKVVRTDDEKQVIYDVNATAILKQNKADYLLKDGDVVKVNLINPGIINKVEVTGEVSYPGLYEIKKNDRLFDVINRAGGITRNTYLPRAYIFRKGADSTNLKADKIEISLRDIENGSGVDNVLLEPNDMIQLFSNAEFGEQQFVEISGEVRKPGKLKRYGGMTLQDLIYLSGGLKSSAEFGRLEISSIVDMDSAQKGLKPTQTVIKSYSVLQNLELDSVASKVLLKPYDQVFVRKNPTFQLQQNVTIEGLVKYPGNYPRLSKDEKLSSYIQRAGGVLDNADLTGAVLIRNKKDPYRVNQAAPSVDAAGNPVSNSADKPVSIDLEKALQEKNTKYDIVLQERDIIYIPEVNPFVTIQGRVQSPVKITFDKEYNRLMYYIDKAGGFGVKPWRKRIYVTYANGKSRRTRNFFFMHFYPKVKEGSTITVPEKQEGKDFGNVIVQSITASIPIIIGAIIIRNL